MYVLGRNIRNGGLLTISKFRLNRSKKNSLDMNLYNKLPIKIKSLSLNRFKSAINPVILNNNIFKI